MKINYIIFNLFINQEQVIEFYSFVYILTLYEEILRLYINIHIYPSPLLGLDMTQSQFF